MPRDEPPLDGLELDDLFVMLAPDVGLRIIQPLEERVSILQGFVNRMRCHVLFEVLPTQRAWHYL